MQIHLLVSVIGIKLHFVRVHDSIFTSNTKLNRKNQVAANDTLIYGHVVIRYVFTHK